MKKEFYSNNGLSINSYEYVQKYKIEINNNKLFTLYEYDKGDYNGYKRLYSSFNGYSFLQYLKDNKIKKYFSCRDDEITG